MSGQASNGIDREIAARGLQVNNDIGFYGPAAEELSRRLRECNNETSSDDASIRPP